MTVAEGRTVPQTFRDRAMIERLRVFLRTRSVVIRFFDAQED